MSVGVLAANLDRGSTFGQGRGTGRKRGLPSGGGPVERQASRPGADGWFSLWRDGRPVGRRVPSGGRISAGRSERRAGMEGLTVGGIPLGVSFAVGPFRPGRDGRLAVAVAFTSGCRCWWVRSVQGKAEPLEQSSPSGRFVSGGAAGSCAGIGWIARRGGLSGPSGRTRWPGLAQGKRRIARAGSPAGLLGTDGTAGTWTEDGRVARNDGSSELFGMGESTGSRGDRSGPRRFKRPWPGQAAPGKRAIL